MENNKSKLEVIKAKAEESKYVPTVNSAVRAGVSTIPFVGGALDHLLFDKADEISTRNIEQSLEEISKKMEQISEDSLKMEWFENKDNF